MGESRLGTISSLPTIHWPSSHDANCGSAASFPNPGWVVPRLQTAGSASPQRLGVDDSGLAFSPRRAHLGRRSTPRGQAGYDTDTVGDRGRTAGCGVWRIAAVRGAWRHAAALWPGTTAHYLVALRRPSSAKVSRTVSTLVRELNGRHLTRGTRYDDVVLLAVSVSFDSSAEVYAVVSLCRLADEDMRDDCRTWKCA